MSFYNWATKNNDKQVVCDRYDEQGNEALCRSTGSAGGSTTRRKFRKKVEGIHGKDKKPKRKLQTEETNEGKNHFNEYYFEGVRKL
jgi:hypothetical protein